jgi:hypothetical protein
MIKSSCGTHLKKRGTERDKLAHMHFRYCEGLRSSRDVRLGSAMRAEADVCLSTARLDCFVAEPVIGPAKGPDPLAPRNDGGECGRSDYPSTFAAFSCTDSPQPQAPTWFGLLKMNWACILSAL